VEVPEEHMGAVVELLGRRRGQMFDMQGVGCVKCSLCFNFIFNVLVEVFQNLNVLLCKTYYISIFIQHKYWIV
jgi:predicted membrane GTPase involved in stress response